MVFVLLGACTPLRGLDVTDAGAPWDVSGSDAASDADAVVDAEAVDADLRDTATDAGCSVVDLCDGEDDDCDPSTADGSGDPALGTPCDGSDADTCSEGVLAGCSLGALTCDDTTGASLEVCGGGDEDCDGVVDEAGATGTLVYYLDADGDGYGADAGAMMLCSAPSGSPRYVTMSGDCDDASNDVRPGRSENCNAIDDDCDGLVDDDACGGDCERRTYGGHTYQLCDEMRPQSIGESRCVGMGYHLVQIEDDAENTFVQSILGLGARTDETWIGLEATGAPAVFRWPDGSMATYTAWDTGEPNASGPCVLMRDDGRWDDIACGSNFAYLCEAP